MSLCQEPWLSISPSGRLSTMTTQIGPDGKRFTLEEPTPDDAPGDTQTVGGDTQTVGSTTEGGGGQHSGGGAIQEKVARKVRSVRTKNED